MIGTHEIRYWPEQENAKAKTFACEIEVGRDTVHYALDIPVGRAKHARELLNHLDENPIAICTDLQATKGKRAVREWPYGSVESS